MIIGACSQENGTTLPDDELVEGLPTVATFSFYGDGVSESVAVAEQNVPATRADADFNSGGKSLSETDEGRIVATDVKMLIFDYNSKRLEKKVDFSSASSVTVQVTSGKKLIFVAANVSDLSDYTTAGAVDAASSFMLKYNALVENQSVVGDLRGDDEGAQGRFTGGQPQLWSINKTSSSRTYKLAKLTSFPTASQGLPMSSGDSLVYTIVPNITSAASSGGTPVEATDSPTNTFKIKLKYMSAKAQLTMLTAGLTGASSTHNSVTYPDYKVYTSANSGAEPKWTLKNHPLNTWYFEHFDGNGVPMSYYYRRIATPTGFDTRFDTGNNLDETVYDYATEAAAIANTGHNFIYTPDNNSDKGNKIYRGQSTFFALRVIFAPGWRITAVTPTPSVAYTYTTTWTQTPAHPTTGYNPSYVYLRKALGYGELSSGTYWADTATIAKALWIQYKYTGANTYGAAEQTWARDSLAAIITAAGGRDNVYYKFTNSVSYYRVDVGQTLSDATIKYGVLRGHKYVACIKQFYGPGFPEEKYLYGDPDLPVEQLANLHVVISVKPWTVISATGIVQ